MKSTTKVLILALCFGAMSGTALAQDDRSFITHQSGDWSNGTTWEEFIPNFGYIWPASQIPNSGNGAIRIGSAHTVTIRDFDVTADQLTVDGTLRVGFGRVLTIADGPGIDLVTNLSSASIWIDGTLVNNGFIQINFGSLKIGTLVNNGDIEIGGTFWFDQGTITGNDLRYGLTGSAVVNLPPGSTIDQDNHVWPSANGPANINVIGNATLNGARTVSGTLQVTGTLHVVGALTNNGTTQVIGTLQVSGTYTNNGTTQISGTFQIDLGGIVSGNEFVYTGFFSKLIFSGSYSVDSGTVFWPSTNGPASIIVPDTVTVTLNTARTATGALDISGTLQVADTLTTNGTTQILSGGLLHVEGVLINNGTAQIRGTLHVAGELTNNATMAVHERLEVDGTLLNIGTIQNYRAILVTGSFTNDGTAQIYGECRLAGALTNNGATLIDGTFQLDQGGVANGNDFEYGVLFGAPGGTLLFNNASGSHEVNSGAVYWPATNGPANVIVQGAGGITMNVARTVIGFFEAAAGVTNVHNLTISGTVRITTNGFFDSSPTYSDFATLVYTDGLYDVGAEWKSGTSVGSGVPMNVEINEGTTVSMPGSPRTCPGNLSIRGSLVLSTTPGADLSVGGNWSNDFYNPGALISNSRAVIFNGANEQAIRGVNTFDNLIINNSAGVSVPGYTDGSEVFETDSVTVQQTLTLTAGNIPLGEDYEAYLVLSGSVSGASSTRHVVTYENGVVIRSIAGGNSFQFPVGPTETSYNPLTIALDPADSTETFSVRVDSTIELGALSDSVCVQRTWDISEATGGDNHAALTFQWSGAEEGASFFRNNSSTYIYNGDYVDVVNNSAASGTDPYIVSTTEEFPITEFSRFVVGTSGALTAIEASKNGNPASFMLSQNYPNPFNPSTTIRYAIPKAEYVLLKVFDLLGKEIETLVSEKQTPGVREIRWNPVGVPSGVYFYQLKVGDFRLTKKLILLH